MDRFEVKGTHITSCTLLGILSTNFPLRHGNCFSMAADNGKDYRIANFAYEDLKELFNRGLTTPVNLLVIGEHTALIYDERISNKWYPERYCIICCPKELLPEPQQLQRQRDIRAGIIVEHEKSYSVHLQDNRL